MIRKPSFRCGRRTVNIRNKTADDAIAFAVIQKMNEKRKNVKEWLQIRSNRSHTQLLGNMKMSAPEKYKIVLLTFDILPLTLISTTFSKNMRKSKNFDTNKQRIPGK